MPSLLTHVLQAEQVKVANGSESDKLKWKCGGSIASLPTQLAQAEQVKVKVANESESGKWKWKWVGKWKGQMKVTNESESGKWKWLIQVKFPS